MHIQEHGVDPARDRVRVVIERLQIALFLIAIALPGIGMLIAPGPAPRGEAPTNNPKVRTETPSPLAALARQFQSRFGFRQPLIRLHGVLMVRELGVSSSEMTLVGRDGWLFLARETPQAGPRTALIYSRNGAPYSQDTLARIAEAMEARRKWLEARGSRYLFVLAPNKDSIYPEYLPPGFTRQRPDSRADQLLAYLQAHTQVKVMDLRPTLLQAKREGTVFFRTDSHWNSAGAFAAQGAIVEVLQPWLPALRPLSPQEYTITRERRPGGDLARTLGLQDLLADEAVRFTPHDPNRVRGLDNSRRFEGRDVTPQAQLVTECPTAPVARAFVQRDSFGEALAPFLAPHFRRTVFAWNHYMKSLEWDLIERERPEVVIHEMVERTLMDSGPLLMLPPSEPVNARKTTSAR